MPNFHPILFKFCAYVKHMINENMHRERKIISHDNYKFGSTFSRIFEPHSYKWPVFCSHISTKCLFYIYLGVMINK